MDGSELKDEIEKEIDYSSKSHFSVTEFFPEYSFIGVPFSSDIIINFDKKISSVSENDFTITNSKKENISNSWYEFPVLSADKKTVRIACKKDDDGNFIMEKLISNLEQLNLQINANLKADDDSVIKRECLSYNFILNTTKDTTPPAILYEIKDNIIRIKNGDEFENLPAKINNNFKNYGASKVYISCLIEEKESGIRGLKFIATSENTSRSVELSKFDVNASNKSGNYYEISDYELNLNEFKDLDDGLITLKVAPVDFAGNTGDFSKKQFSVIKDTSINTDRMFIYSKNKKDNLTVESINEAVKTVYWSQAIDVFFRNESENCTDEITNYQIAFGTAPDKLGDYKPVLKFEKIGNDFTEYSYTFDDFSSSEDLYFNIMLTDKFGNTQIFPYAIPSAPELDILMFGKDNTAQLFMHSESKLGEKICDEDDYIYRYKFFRIYEEDDDGKLKLLEMEGNSFENGIPYYHSPNITNLSPYNFINLTGNNEEDFSSKTHRLYAQEFLCSIRQAYYDLFVDSTELENLKTAVLNDETYFHEWINYGNITAGKLSKLSEMKNEITSEKVKIKSYSVGVDSLLSPLNSGKCVVEVELENVSADSTYCYICNALSSDGIGNYILEDNFYSKNKKIVVKTGYLCYQIQVIEKDKFGKVYISEPSEMFYINDTDTTAPAVWISFDPGETSYGIPMNSYDSSFLKETDEINHIAEFEYFALPLGAVGYKQSLPDEELAKYPSARHSFVQYYTYSYFQLPVYLFNENENYTLYYKAEDKKGNFASEYAGLFNYSITDRNYDVSYNPSTKGLDKTLVTEKVSDSETRYSYVEVFDNLNSWISQYITRDFEYQDTETYDENSFIRYSEFSAEYNIDGNYLHSFEFTKPQYIFTGSKATNVKFVIKGLNELKIEFDNSFFIHTIYADKNLGNNYYDWEIKGQAVNQKQIDPDKSGVCNYYYSLDEIPENMYYTVIIWFADGSHKMLEPVKK